MISLGMDSDEQDVCNYLKMWPKQFVSLREISQRAAGKRRYREDPYWANQVLLRMVEKGWLESDSASYYRLTDPEKLGASIPKKKRWVSPEIQKILDASGKSFEIPDEDDKKKEPPDVSKE